MMTHFPKALDNPSPPTRVIVTHLRHGTPDGTRYRIRGGA